MSTAETRQTHGCDQDVVIVGGGPAGCSAGVFTARYGLDTLIFDRGRSSLKLCAHLENYLGFPAGIDIETFYDLLHDHVEEAGCRLRADLVESVDRLDAEEGGFVVEPQEGQTVTARRVVAATRYDGEYLRPLDGDAMFATSHDGDEEYFDREYPDDDGRTPVDGLYVASPSTSDDQAVMAAGRGARVARTVLRDVRKAAGIPSGIADHHDWVRQESNLTAEWTDRDRWREWFDEHVPADGGAGTDDLRPVREREIDRHFAAYIDDTERERRRRRAHERLLDHVDDERILDRASEIEQRRGSAGEDG